MERNTKRKHEESINTVSKVQMSSNKTSDSKKKYNWYFPLCSLRFECVLFNLFGCVIALAGNIATGILYYESVLSQSSYLSNDTKHHENNTAQITIQKSQQQEKVHNSTSPRKVILGYFIISNHEI